MSKKRNLAVFLVILLITNILTFGLTNLASIKFNNKIYIPVLEYNKLRSIQNKFSKVLMIENYIEDNYLRDIDEDKLEDGLLKGMVQALEDPYSIYMDLDEYSSMVEQTSGTYAGIGIVVTPGDDNLITVVSPIEGTPGERAGIKNGDKIVKVDGKEFYAENMDQAVKHMKGEPNTKVVLTIMRKDKSGASEVQDIEITRELIRLVTVKSEVIDENIGYIKLTSFDELTYDDFKKGLNDLGSKNIEGLIIDLRNNPGGLLDICAQVIDELVGEGTIVYTENKEGKREYLKSNKAMVTYPLVLLINEGSASASEIMAGAIKDHKRGTIIGKTTFGKGVVQRIKDLNDGTGLKVTISEFFTPNGSQIHGIGVAPDIEVDLPEDIEVIGLENLEEDSQLQKALEVLKTKIK